MPVVTVNLFYFFDFGINIVQQVKKKQFLVFTFFYTASIFLKNCNIFAGF